MTIICDAVTEDMPSRQRYLIVNSPQVINGQQTTRALAEHSSEGASVLVKLIRVNRETTSGQQHYGRLVSQIVSATNFQNAIRLSDLKANDIEQVRIERELRKWGVLYSRKTQSKKEVSSHLGSKYKVKIKKEELAAATAGCLLEPSVLRLGKEYLFDDGYYSKIFSGQPAYEHLVHYWLWRAIRKHFKTGEQRYSVWLCLRFLWGHIRRSDEKTRNSIMVLREDAECHSQPSGSIQSECCHRRERHGCNDLLSEEPQRRVGHS